MTVTERADAARQWRAFFADPEYPRLVGGILTEQRTRAELAALDTAVELSPGTRVLDLGCGQGRLSVPLAARGCEVVGLDGSAALLAHARAAADAAGVRIEFVHADMRDLAHADRFDVVLNMGTAFGYAPESDHQPTLAAVRRALRPGGTLLLDTENRDRMVRADRRISFDRAGTTVECDRSYDPYTGRWHEVLRWRHDGRTHRAEYSLRLYTVAELVAALRSVGFTEVDAWGDLAGTPYELDSPRTVLRARAAG
ncbi:class I SAM-dependent methyltransferase [Plantactinospora mayteni]|uniref:Methyltransferase n=1 Tax=Plantactinospora mayteni TaxID=566021 RepID=A0ABQ4ERA7_9ACTN|nr:class I SAM-dependent methyltransferase [Plantactinospora mayteni]GIG97140.1 methyltransferase [Plantactinospora mayteni]